MTSDFWSCYRQQLLQTDRSSNSSKHIILNPPPGHSVGFGIKKSRSWGRKQVWIHSWRIHKILMTLCNTSVSWDKIWREGIFNLKVTVQQHSNSAHISHPFTRCNRNCNLRCFHPGERFQRVNNELIAFIPFTGTQTSASTAGQMELCSVLFCLCWTHPDIPCLCLCLIGLLLLSDQTQHFHLYLKVYIENEASWCFISVLHYCPPPPTARKVQDSSGHCQISF